MGHVSLPDIHICSDVEAMERTGTAGRLILFCVMRIVATRGLGHEKAESRRVGWVHMMLARNEYDLEEEYWLVIHQSSCNP